MKTAFLWRTRAVSVPMYFDAKMVRYGAARYGTGTPQERCFHSINFIVNFKREIFIQAHRVTGSKVIQEK